MSKDIFEHNGLLVTAFVSPTDNIQISVSNEQGYVRK